MEIHSLPYCMPDTKKPIPIATVSFLRHWQLAHRHLTGKTARRRHVYMTRILALTGMTPSQVAVVTAHQAQVEQAFCCDFVAEHIAAELRPSLFASVVLESIGEGKPMVIDDSPDGSDDKFAEEVAAALKALAKGEQSPLSRDVANAMENMLATLPNIKSRKKA